MLLRPPRSTRTDTLFPYTTLFRSELARRVVAAGDAAHEAAQQLGRQVVDAVEPEVLEGLQRHRLAAARQPADDQQDGLAVVFRRLAHGLPRSRKWECRAMNAAAGSPPFARRMRSEERRVGQECVSTCGSRWSP